MTSSDLYIIKLGGAAITDKTKDYTLRPEVLSRVMNEIISADRTVIIVHGAGSFAHNIANEYKLSKGIDSSISQDLQFKGISITRRSLLNLHTSVLDASLAANLNPFSFPVSAIMVSSGDQELYSRYFDGLNEALSNGFTPILYGDISFDIKTKFRVISGDRIIRVLVEHFNLLKSQQSQLDFVNIKVIFGSDVDGLYDKNPLLEDAKLIEKISFTEISELIEVAGDSAGTDVTGGMKGKLMEIKQISELGSEVQIVNITKENRLYDTLVGQTGIRTTISRN